MGILHRQRDGARIHLPADALLGRGDSFDVPLRDERASAPHARMRWRKSHWYIQDLASRNGTFVNGHKLGPGERRKLSKQATIQLGSSEESYQLVDVDGPRPLARSITTGLTIAMDDDLLILPNMERALACIYRSTTNPSELIIDTEHRVSPIVDREVVVLDGERWQLRTQLNDSQLTDWVRHAMSVETISLTINANLNLEEITLKVQHEDRLIEVGHHAWHELLMLLARERVRDKDKPLEEQGWIQRDRLCTMLNKSVQHLNVAIHRARDQFRNLGVLPAANVIERRRGPQDIRIGVRRIILEGHAAP